MKKFTGRFSVILSRRGAVMIEFVLTIPIIINVILFGLELVKIYLEQTAVDVICQECTFSLISNGNVSEFDSIFQKHLPQFCKVGRARYYCRVYTDLAKMMSTSPYGGECIRYPTQGNDNSAPTANAVPVSFGCGDASGPHQGNDTTIPNNDVGQSRTTLLQTKVPAGYAFVLTVVYRHEFSSALVKVLFNGGTNTSSEDYYILWSRGSGIIDASDK
ncbi:MAG: hypothetical protein E7015_02090 [Alphaproteobacteria bacterium]|nr:hypothetical protein [Alphaproteobacteria bacterium]